jgi:hypothetical protein
VATKEGVKTPKVDVAVWGVGEVHGPSPAKASALACSCVRECDPE